MTALGNASGTFGGSYMINSLATEPATGIGAFTASYSLHPNATEPATGIGAFTASYSLHPNATDPARLTFHTVTTRPDATGGFVPLGPGYPRG